MKKTFLFSLLTFSFLAAAPAMAQDDLGSPRQNTPSNLDSYSVFQEGAFGNAITGGLGITTFGNQLFYTINFSPELAIGKLGVGLDLNLRISQDGKLREEDWNDGVSSYLRIIRYLRYGFKKEEIYARLGQLDAARLGHGTIMYLYQNNSSYDARRVGIEFDMDFRVWGFESVVSDVSTFNIVGIRPYVRPLAELPIPIINGLELGATYVADFDRNANLVATPQSIYPASQNGEFLFNSVQGERRGNLSTFGLDLGLPLVRLPFFDSDFYIDYVKIIGFGDGAAVGVSASLKNLGEFITLSAKLEHRVYGERFQMGYFDALYEQDRLNTVFATNDTTQIVRTRANNLANYSAPGPGVYGDLGASVLGKLRLFGSYQRLYATPRNGQLHLGAGLKDLIPSVIFRADYYKRDIGFETDLFTLDDRSLSVVELGYYPYPYLLLSVVYQWTYTPNRDADENIIGYTPVRRFEPRVSFSFRF